MDNAKNVRTEAKRNRMMQVPNLPIFMDTAVHNIAKDLYLPCLRWASSYDRGVGYFSSAWFRENAVGLSHFAVAGGKARWLISPILDAEDAAAIRQGYSHMSEGLVTKALLHNIDEIRTFLEEDTRNALAWLISDTILDLRIAVPGEHLEGGDFHPKFGIFRDSDGNALAFTGSVNDSHQGTLNYEVISIFATWQNTGNYVETYAKRFDDLWNGKVPGVRVYELPQAVHEEILRLRTTARPYSETIRVADQEHLWPHQLAAVRTFLKEGHGILEMATGTGKTRTALAIAKTLLTERKIQRVIVSVEGTDLLEQWHRELLQQTSLTVIRQYGGYNELPLFQIAGADKALIISRAFLAQYIRQFSQSVFSNTLVIFDEVHGLGSASMVDKLSTKIAKFGYRLGLSATPERTFDEVGSHFIEQEIGPVIYQFGLDRAIGAGILCEFEYVPLSFRFTPEDEERRRPLIKALLAANDPKKQATVDVEDIRRRLSIIRKLSVAKIPVFADYLSGYPETLDRSIIFVETIDYGRLVQEVVMRFSHNYHTYFGEDARENLYRFANGELDCLITSRRISEGIDIKSVNNVILFTADRSKLQTIQRMGRCLRVDPSQPNKRARVVDFVEVQQETDTERSRWLTQLSQVRREQ